MAKTVMCRQLFPTGCEKVFQSVVPGDVLVEVWEHAHNDPKHADIREELEAKQGFDLKDWQKHTIKLWSAARQEESDMP